MEKVREISGKSFSTHIRAALRGAVAVLATVALGVTALATASGADAATTATRIVVTTSTAWARPATTAKATGKLIRNQRVVVTARKSGWARTTRGWVRSTALSSRGHYADTLAAKHGLRVQYTNKQACGTKVGVNTATRFAASGCYVDGWSKIQLTTSATYSGTAAWKRTAVRDLVLHEVAHATIYRKAGSAQPAIAGGRSENLADAYAWKYFGTSRSAGGYGFTASDVSRATAVHAGRA